MSELIMRKANIKKGSDNPLKNKVAKLTKAQVMEIVEQKIADLNTTDANQAAKIVAGQCRSIGVEVEK
jgi:large subunit ribosomal protein L11